MDQFDPEAAEDLPMPVPAAPASKRTALIGAVFGMTALAATIVGVGAVASAQDDEPASTTAPAAESTPDDDATGGTNDDYLDENDFAAFDECMAEQLGDLWITPDIDFGDIDFDELDFDEDDIIHFTEGDIEFEDLAGGVEFFEGDFDGDFPEPTPEEIAEWEAEEQRFVDAEDVCNDLLPEEVKAEIAAWQPYEECIDGQIGDLDDPWANGTEPSDADWEAHDAAWEAADEACRDLLPADVQEEMAAWDAFDQCLQDAGVFEEPFGMSAVHIETGEGFQIAEFGETAGSVTISGTAGNLEVIASGGVTVLDEGDLDAQFEQFDEAHRACEDQLPEDLKEHMFFDEEIFLDDED